MRYFVGAETFIAFRDELKPARNDAHLSRMGRGHALVHYSLTSSVSLTDQSYLSIKWHSNKTPLCWALVAAVAVGVAKGQDSDIEDNAGFFTKSNVQTPNEFCRTLGLATRQKNVDLAADALYAEMPKSAEIAKWLQRRSPA